MPSVPIAGEPDRSQHGYHQNLHPRGLLPTMCLQSQHGIHVPWSSRTSGTYAGPPPRRLRRDLEREGEGHSVSRVHTRGFRILADVPRCSRLWKSLRVLETLVSSFLGRPGATIHPLSERDAPLSASSAKTARSQSIDSIYKLLDIADDVLVVDWQNPNSPSSAKATIDRLAQWSGSLSSSPLVDSHVTATPASRQEIALANLQLTCSYYYATMLATRPFLCLSCLHKRAATQDTASSLSYPAQTPASAVTPDSDLALLTKSCEDAAVFMIGACHDTLQEGHLLDNMCLLQSVPSHPIPLESPQHYFVSRTNSISFS